VSGTTLRGEGRGEKKVERERDDEELDKSEEWERFDEYFEPLIKNFLSSLEVQRRWRLELVGRSSPACPPQTLPFSE